MLHCLSSLRNPLNQIPMNSNPMTVIILSGSSGSGPAGAPPPPPGPPAPPGGGAAAVGAAPTPFQTFAPQQQPSSGGGMGLGGPPPPPGAPPPPGQPNVMQVRRLSFAPWVLVRGNVVGIVFLMMRRMSCAAAEIYTYLCIYCGRG